MARWPLFPILGSGRCLYHLVHVMDLVEALLLAAVHPNAVGEVFLAGAEQALPLEMLGHIIGREYGTQLRVVRIPIGPFF